MFAMKPAWLGLCCTLAATSFAPTAQAGTIEAINHTHWAINRFSVDGQSGIDVIGAYRGGGADLSHKGLGYKDVVELIPIAGQGAKKGAPGRL